MVSYSFERMPSRMLNEKKVVRRGRFAVLRHIRYRRRKFIVKAQAACFVGLLCLLCGLTSLESIGESGGLDIWNDFGDEIFNKENYSETRRQLGDLTNRTSIISSPSTDDCLDDSNTTESESLFPDDLFTKEERQNGAIFLHIICIMYTFVGIAIVCDDYFAMALELICDKLDLSPDVAGATFMAAGGSAPELATSILGVFVATSDIGFGTIVGSAVFNVMFVIAACCFATSGRDLALTWWPLIRDCSYYCASIIVLVGCVTDQEITLFEGFVLLFCYVGYIGVMAKNEQLECMVTKKVEASAENTKTRPDVGLRKYTWVFVTHPLFDFIIYLSILLNIVAIIEPKIGDKDLETLWDKANTIFNVIFATEMALKIHAFTFFGYWQDPGNAFDGMLVLLIVFELFQAGSGDGGALTSARFLKFFRAMRTLRTLRIVKFIIGKSGMAPAMPKAPPASESVDRKLSLKSTFSHNSLDKCGSITSPASVETDRTVSTKKEVPMEGKKSPLTLPPISHKSGQVVPAEVALPAPSNLSIRQAQSSEENGSTDSSSSSKDIETVKDNLAGPPDEEDDEDGPTDPFDVPEEFIGKLKWAMLLPYTFGMWATIPNCGKEGKDHLFGVTFVASIVWIGFISYFMVWMATLLGETMGIRESIMGITLIAAGTSIPDLISSVIVARQGYGDMAVSSSIGSNIFDILIGLPVPWILYTGINHPATIQIGSAGITFMVILLFLMVGMTCGSIYFSGWKLTFRLGVTMVIMYFIFLTFCVLLEYGYIFSQC